MTVVIDVRDQQWLPRPAVPLDDGAATVAATAGSKAANLALARRAGLPVVDGFVVPAPVVAGIDVHRDLDAVRDAWRQLSESGTAALVVRSSAPDEDLGTSSRAGVYRSVVSVRGWDAFVDAFWTVVRSSGDAGAMAVLVQRHVEPRRGGVMFGIDPVSGRTDRLVIAAVAGGPWALVQGEVAGRRTVVTRRARVTEADGDAEPQLSRGERRTLVDLAQRAAALFGGPQDIEWAIGADGRVLLLQSRPITAAAGRPAGPRLGPGPVAETFPEPLRPLEVDLWIPPMRDAIAWTLRFTRSASSRQLRRSPVVAVVGRRVAVDLDLLEPVDGRRRLRRAFDPRPSLRRLAAAWPVGRIRAALPALIDDLLEATDRELTALPPAEALGQRRLLAVLTNSRQLLTSLHAHEMLAGALDRPEPSEVGTGAHAALAAIARGRAAGWSDAEIMARAPESLAVVPPAIARPTLPGSLPDLDPWRPVPPLPRRELVRLRIRWVHALTALVAVEAGRRIGLREPEAVAFLTFEQLAAALEGRGDAVAVTATVDPSPPLPAAFRVAADGSVVPEPTAAGSRQGVGAGGGRASGRVALRDPIDGDVLVVATLSPELAPQLPRLAGIVAETGSPLSHLAILAREMGVPVVVGYPGATQSLLVGQTVVVDGRTGEVAVLDEAEVAW